MIVVVVVLWVFFFFGGGGGGGGGWIIDTVIPADSFNWMWDSWKAITGWLQQRFSAVLFSVRESHWFLPRWYLSHCDACVCVCLSLSVCTCVWVTHLWAGAASCRWDGWKTCQRVRWQLDTTMAWGELPLAGFRRPSSTGMKGHWVKGGPVYIPLT